MLSTDVHTFDQLATYITGLESTGSVSYPVDEYPEELA